MKDLSIHVLELSQDAFPILDPGQVLELPIPHQPYTLCIVLPGTSPVLSETNVLKCNFPVEGAEFKRSVFKEYPLTATLTENCEVSITISHSGAFEVSIGQNVSWNFVVANGFKLNGEYLTANALCVQTVLSKLVDPHGDVKSSKWDEALENIAHKKYNMIHFVPLQTRGESNSPFSIADQLEWDVTTFPNGESDVEYLTTKLEKHGILGLSDIVLNHTASNSKWLADHLDAGYSAETAPHLQCAIDLDTELLKFSDNKDSIIEIHDYNELQNVVEKVVRDAARSIKLWEYYIIDVQSLSHAVEKQPFQGTPCSDLPQDVSELADHLVHSAGRNLDTLGPRFNRSVDTTILAEYVAGSYFSSEQLLNEVNAKLYCEYDSDLAAAISSIEHRQRYLRLDADGPHIGKVIGKESPIIETYFNRRFGTPLACNGWVWAGNPLIDHAGPDSKAFIRRELIVWQDCIKLRYGNSPNDSPYLWDHMSRYAKMLARHFAGLRIDNCHSTPLHVGEFILDEARRVRPNLYVVAELFSGSQEMDKLYVERLGIASLLREAIMAGSPQDLSTIIHNNGNLAIGSFMDRRINGKRAHSWLMEATHDNETLADKRTVEDTLPTAGLVAMCQVASGSTYGTDECYPHALNVVSESRPYVFGGGITEVKGILNKLHKEMAQTGMIESYTDYQGQYITVHRINPATGEGVLLVARTKFWNDDPKQKLKPVVLESSEATWFGGWSLKRIDNNQDDVKDNEHIFPIQTELVKLPTNKPEFIEWSSTIHINPDEFPQGSIALWTTKRTFDTIRIERLVSNQEWAADVVEDLNLVDLNHLLHRTEAEENTCSHSGVYNIPGYGPLVYAGLQGWETLLQTIVKHQDLGHPLCDNLRAGLWAFEYIINRASSKGVRNFLCACFEATRSVPSFLRPRYFVSTVLTLYEAATNHALNLMGLNPKKTSLFYKQLALTSVQMVNLLPDCSLFPDKQVPTMAAGLPHFSVGIMRCWGRDVFLSFKGLLLQFLRFDIAKQHILGFGSTLKYGLIPNLLDSGRNPRYNARDATWFFVQSVQDFCKATKSMSILSETVQRRFPLDDSYTETPPDGVFSSVGDLVFEILSRHAKGIKYREHNAGPEIDMHMKSNGFNQHIWTDWETGIIFGGNQDNCGTWQDKMGESPKAGSEGVPGTPRDGAAIEITAMLKSCLRWVNEVRSSGGFDWPESVETQHGNTISIKEWEELLQNNFERCYYIPERDDGNGTYDVEWSIVNRRGIYKDIYRSGKAYEDYQFRPNFTLAVVVAPELFDVNKVSRTIELADKVLRGPLGAATLDPDDLNYRPCYINGEETTDFATSKGRNYHQGPEWVWLFGTFLQAYSQTLKRQGVGANDITSMVLERIQAHVKQIRESPWCGLPELTQKNGDFCADSSPTQAWSSARLIEAIHDAEG